MCLRLTALTNTTRIMRNVGKCRQHTYFQQSVRCFRHDGCARLEREKVGRHQTGNRAHDRLVRRKSNADAGSREVNKHSPVSHFLSLLQASATNARSRCPKRMPDKVMGINTKSTCAIKVANAPTKSTALCRSSLLSCVFRVVAQWKRGRAGRTTRNFATRRNRAVVATRADADWQARKLLGTLLDQHADGS
jgi:hypothetical protein